MFSLILINTTAAFNTPHAALSKTKEANVRTWLVCMLDLPSQTRREVEHPPGVHLEPSILSLKDLLAYLFLIMHMERRDFTCEWRYPWRPETPSLQSCSCKLPIPSARNRTSALQEQ